MLATTLPTAENSPYRAKAPCYRTDIPLRGTYRHHCYRQRRYCSSPLLPVVSKEALYAPCGVPFCPTLLMRRILSSRIGEECRQCAHPLLTVEQQVDVHAPLHRE